MKLHFFHPFLILHISHCRVARSLFIEIDKKTEFLDNTTYSHIITSLRACKTFLSLLEEKD